MLGAEVIKAMNTIIINDNRLRPIVNTIGLFKCHDLRNYQDVMYFG